MGVSLSLHGVKKIELERTSISVIKQDRIPYEVWNLYINHGSGDEKGEHFSISIFVKKGKSLKLDSMIYEDEDRSPEYKFGIHRGIGSPENPEDWKILEERDGMDILKEKVEDEGDLTDEEVIRKNVEGIRKFVNKEKK